MKNDRGNRKQFLGSGAAGATPGGYQGKFNATMFGQTLLNKMQKENTSSSQMFQPGSFAKYIGDGSTLNADKTDPTQLPFNQKDANNGFKATFGSPSNTPSFMQNLKPNGFSGVGSSKSGSSGIDKEGGPLSETGSNA
jgi:hypothetical protein